MTKRRRSQKASSGGLVLLVIAALVAAFLVLRNNPALASKLPPQVDTAIRNVQIPTGVPDIQLPTGLPDLQLPTAAQPASATAQLGHQTKTTGCQASSGMPDGACTPGAVFPNVTADEVCKSGYATSVRDVPESEKEQVYAEYGIASHTAGQYEVDHLVSLELGGSNDVSNLWPEAASPSPGFHEKDRVENYLHDQVCSGAISLAQAQQEIATNWLAVYNQMPK